MRKWTKWMDMLNEDVYRRLGNCRSIKSDIAKMVDAKWAWYRETGKDKKGFTREDALISILELLDSNGQYDLTDLSEEEYNELMQGY